MFRDGCDDAPHANNLERRVNQFEIEGIGRRCIVALHSPQGWLAMNGLEFVEGGEGPHDLDRFVLSQRCRK